MSLSSDANYIEYFGNMAVVTHILPGWPFNTIYPLKESATWDIGVSKGYLPYSRALWNRMQWWRRIITNSQAEAYLNSGSWLDKDIIHSYNSAKYKKCECVFVYNIMSRHYMNINAFVFHTFAIVKIKIMTTCVKWHLYIPILIQYTIGFVFGWMTVAQSNGNTYIHV